MFTKKRLFSGLYAQEFIYHHQLVELEGWLACLLCLEPDGEEIAGALYGWLLTDRERSCYLLVTGPLENDSDEEYIIAAPAGNVEEARAVCEALGAYPDLFR